MIRTGLRYEDLLAALCLAAVHNVQPYPDVGYKYHSVMVLRPIHLATEQLPALTEKIRTFTPSIINLRNTL
jgi:hypothetical protein